MGAAMHKFHPLQVMLKKFVKGGFLNFNLRAVGECYLHELLQNWFLSNRCSDRFEVSKCAPILMNFRDESGIAASTLD